MTSATIAIVVLGVAAVAALTFGRGLDLVSLIILALIAGVGCLAVAAARRTKRQSIAPARCERCDGLISALSPYCKHCGARAARP